MTVQEVAKKVMKDKSVRQVDIAERYATKQPSVAMWFQSDSMRVDSLLKILDACGYDLIVVDRDGDHPSYRVSNESGEDIVSVAVEKKTDAMDYAAMIAKAVDSALKIRGL